MKALVTGGTGFIGVSLIEELLERGYQVLCVAKDPLNADDLRGWPVEMIFGDLLNGISWQSILPKVEIVFNLAGVTRAKTKEEYYSGNYYATSTLIQACLRFAPNLRRFLHVSTLAVVGPSNDGRPLTEEAGYRPLTTYARSKMLGEQEVLRYAHVLPVTVVRPSAVYGPRERDFLQLFQLVNQEVLPLVGLRDKHLSLVHVSDLVRGIIAASESPVAEGNVYFLGSEEAYTCRQVGEMIAKVSGRNPLRLRLPHFMALSLGLISEIMATLCTKKIPTCNLEKVRDMMQDAWVCDISKARRDFGFRQAIGLDYGMKNTYEWYRKNGWLN